jgi:hypothetical protein
MMNTTLVETKTLEERCGFSPKGAWIKIKQLRDKYGVEELARLTGAPPTTIRSYCSESYMKKHKMQESTWEKYFGKWGLKDPEFPNADPVEEAEDDIMQAINAGEEIMVMVNNEEPEDKKEEPVEPPKQPRLILEVPSLEELDAALERFGFKMLIE